ncbi:hypothetical protein [Luteimonas sp. e5]
MKTITRFILLIAVLAPFSALAQSDRDEQFLRESLELNVRGAGGAVADAELCGYPQLAADFDRDAIRDVRRRYGKFIDQFNISDAELSEWIEEGKRRAKAIWHEDREQGRELTCDNIRLMVRDDALLK